MPTRLLIVEDDFDVRSALAAVLGDEGYLVTEASDGTEAIACVHDAQFDVILSDVQMPGANGIDVLRAVKEIAPETEVVIMTAFASLRVATDCIRAGAFDLIQKPIEVETLVTVMTRATEKQRLFRSSQSILSNQDIEQLPRVIVEAAMNVMGADDASLMLTGADHRLYLAYSHSLPSDVQAGVRISFGDGIAGMVADLGRPAVLTGDHANEPILAQASSPGRIKSSIVYPLVSGDRTIGILNLNRLVSDRPFQRTDLKNASILASQSVLALQNATLIRSLMGLQRMASVGQIAGGIAHEINNPITCVLEGVKYAREGLARYRPTGASAEQRDAGDSIDRIESALSDAADGARRIREIVADISALARTDTNARTVLDINEVIRSALRAVGADLAGRAKVTSELGESLFVMGSYGPLSQLFINLLTYIAQTLEPTENVVHEVSVVSHRSDEVIHIRVHSTGLNLAPGVLPKLFDPFFARQHAETPAALGLALSRDLARKNGGDLRVQAMPRGGSTFIVEFDATSAPKPSHSDVRDQKEQNANLTAIRGRILLIDDEPTILRALGRTLGRSHDVSTALGGIKALEILSSGEQFDLIVCDVLMPDVNGMDVFRRACAERPAVADAFVFMSACVDQTDIEAFSRTVSNPVLEKPSGLAVLPELIARRTRARVK